MMLSSKSFMNIRNRIGPETDPLGTQNNTGTGPEALISNTSYCVRPESHALVHL